MSPTGTSTATRTLVVWCPDWPVVAAGTAPGDPSVVVHANRVVAVSPAARAEGVEVGLRRREAQRRCPAVVVHQADPARDARAFEPVVAALATALTPGIELSRPGSCAFATRGPSRYFGGDEALAARAAAVAAEVLGPRVDVAGPPRVGVADGPFAAGWAARRAGTGALVVPVGASSAFLAPLEVGAVDRPELAGLLVRLGITTLGALAALPAPEVVDRFGPEGEWARRLAAGEDPRAPDARRPPPELEVVMELDPPVERVEQAAFLARPLAEELHARLSSLGLACTRVLVEAETEHDEVWSRCWRADGALGPAAIAERVRWQLDGWLHSPQRPTGGITWLRLRPDEVVPDTGTQVGFWGGASVADERARRALARLEGLLGPEAVTMAEVRGGRGPGDRVGRVPVGTIGPGLAGATAPAGAPGAAAGAAGAGPWPGRIPAPAPAVVHPVGVPAELFDAAGVAVSVSGRGMISADPAGLAVAGGAVVAVRSWAGPWPADERWWDAAGHRRRARLQVVTATGQAHLLAVQAGRWEVEATYD